MSKTIYLPPDAERSGIDITWTPSAKRLDFSGWYDGCVGLRGGSMTLLEFFEQIGISEKDCKKAWSKP